MITIILFFSVPLECGATRFAFADSANNGISFAAVRTFYGMRCFLGGSDFFFAHFKVVFFADFELFLLFDGGIFADSARYLATNGINEAAE